MPNKDTWEIQQRNLKPTAKLISDLLRYTFSDFLARGGAIS